MMRCVRSGSRWLTTLALLALPLVTIGCAETPAPSSPSAGAATDDLGDDLGAPMESGSGLTAPEAGSALE